ncbi:MAG TPA: septal ring lytic transglycosylase RlpA family protein, partial [Thermoanaerobaculia bacterium]|nr:septal ring lytic transglycosylase RlpA family protein [Thermoanaerobaculia bacterium]
PPAPSTLPETRPGGIEEGIASWYGGDDGFEGKPTASGEIYDGEHMTAAHRTLPLGSIVEVHNLDNGRVARVRINDRGPFVKGRIIDLSRRAASELGVTGPGTASVRLTLVNAGLVEPQSQSSPTGLWAVQVGSFADRGRAERQAERVRAGGKHVYLEPYQGLSRVKVGPFDSRQVAQDTLAQLESQGFEGIVVPSGK